MNETPAPRRRTAMIVGLLALAGMAASLGYLSLRGGTSTPEGVALAGSGLATSAPSPSPTAPPLSPSAQPVMPGTGMPSSPTQASRSTSTPAAADPQFPGCAEARAAGYGPYRRGSDPEYAWYRDADGDGIACDGTGSTGSTGGSTSTSGSTSGGSTGVHCNGPYYRWSDGTTHCSPQPQSQPTSSPKPQPKPTATSGGGSSYPALVKPHGGYNGDLKCTRLSDGTMHFTYSFTFTGTYYWVSLTNGTRQTKNEAVGYNGSSSTRTVTASEDHPADSKVAGQPFYGSIKVAYENPGGGSDSYATVTFDANETYPSC